MTKNDTLWYKDNAGISIWLSPEATAALSNDVLADASESEIRQIITAGPGMTLTLSGEFIGSRAWLKDGMSGESIREVPESEWKAAQDAEISARNDNILDEN